MQNSVMLQIIPGLSSETEFVLVFTISAAISILIIIFLFRRIQKYGDYAYTNARISAMKSKIFRKDKLNSLLETRSLQNLISSLEESPYGEYLETEKGGTPDRLEPSLNKHLYHSYKKIASIAPRGMEEIFNEIGKKTDIENIETILSGKSEGLSRDEIEMDIHPRKYMSEEVYEKAISSSDVSEVLRILEDTEYGGMIEESRDIYEETGNLVFVFSNIEKKYLENVWRKVKKSDADGCEVVQEAIGIDIDIKNILTIMRCKKNEVDSEKIRDMIVPIHSGINQENVSRAIESKNIKEAVMALKKSKYEEALENGLDKYERTESILSIENKLREFLLESVRSLSIQYYSGVGPLINYLYEKETEVKNLTAIINGQAGRLEEEKIKDKLIEPEMRK